MLWWTTPATQQMPAELEESERQLRRRMRVERYRSRSEVTLEHIYAAFSWLRLSKITGETLEDPDTRAIWYNTSPVKRGVPEAEALEDAKNILMNMLGSSYPLLFATFNTRTDAGNSAHIKAWFEEQEYWTHLDINEQLISSPTHKIDIYKFKTETTEAYAILNNLDTPAVVYKIAAAIMRTMNKFGDDTEQFATAWASGNGTTVYTVVNDYYKNIKDLLEKKEREKALNTLCEAMNKNREEEFKNRINSIQAAISRLFEQIESQNATLNNVKAEYLMYVLGNTEEKSNELRKFLEACGKNIASIKVSGEDIYIAYRTQLIYYEADVLRRYFESTRDNCVTTANLETQQLLEDIFIKEKYTVLIESGVRINLDECRVWYADPTGITQKPRQGIPNPHHKYYNCWGDNESNIRLALMEKEYITAIATVFAAMSGINIADTAVFQKFIHDELFVYPDVPFLKNNETGEIITKTEYDRRYTENASNETNE